jgi:hypothetical protein
MREFNNPRKLPVLKIDSSKVPCILNPEILSWSPSMTEEGIYIGRGLVWVDSDTPLKTLHEDWFAVKETTGEVRIEMKMDRASGNFAGMRLERSQKGDLTKSSCL